MAELSTLIPKKTLGGGESFNYSVGVGAFFRISIILFLLAGMMTGGLYLFKNYVSANLEEQKSLLKKIEVEFEPSLIEELERVSNSIKSAKDILRNRSFTSKIFDMLEAHTLANVSFGSFSFAYDKNSVDMKAEATSYTDVAAQTSIFASLPEVASASFLAPSLTENGTITFSLILKLK